MLMKEAWRTFKTFLYRDKIASLSIGDLIRGNHESALAVFKGFFGEPSWTDCDTMIAHKNTDGSFSEARLRHAQALISRFGWRLSAHRTVSGTAVKVVMVPGGMLSEYLTVRSLGGTFHNQAELYRSLL